MTRKTIPLRLIVSLLVLTVAVSVATTAVAGDLRYHEGTFVVAGLAKITFLARDGLTEQTLPCVELVHIMRNGRSANLRDLVRGDLVQLITNVQLGKEYIVGIIAVAPE